MKSRDAKNPEVQDGLAGEMMNRQVKTSAEIAEWITEQVRQHDDGQDFKLTSVIPLKQPATDGCN